MKKIAVLNCEFDTDIMISNEDLKEMYDGNWLKFMQETFKEEGISLFDDIKLIDILEGEDKE